MTRTFQLRVYGLVFAAAGVVFVFASAPLSAALNRLGAWLPGASPIPGGPATLWLGLAGAMMGMIAYLSFVLAEDPRPAPAWNAIILSKAVSTALFAYFALRERNTLFLLGSLVDGPICLHLLLLRRGCRGREDLLAARLPDSEGPFYEVWFAKLNDPETGNALWVRYTAARTAPGGEASCWCILFDRDRREVLSSRFTAPLSELGGSSGGAPFALGDSSVAAGRLRGKTEKASWDISWEPSPAPAFHFVPRSLALLGLAASDYLTPVSLGFFSGEAVVEGRRYVFKAAPGSLGHLWGRRMADNWRWAHAVFAGPAGPSVLEILSAQVRLGPFLGPRLTTAHLWHAGRHHRAAGLVSALSSRSKRQGDLWTFRVDFGGLTAEGAASPDPALTAVLDYASPEGRRLVCRNSKTGSLQLALRPKDGGPAVFLETSGAAVEFVETAP